MEAHLVHYNEKYGNLKEATSKKDGVAVAAFFIQANGRARNENFGVISDLISKIQEPGTKFNINPKGNLFIKPLLFADDNNYFSSYF